MKKIISFLFISVNIFAQTTDIRPTTVSFPVHTTSECLALTTADGLRRGTVVFNSDLSSLVMYDGCNWKLVLTEAAASLNSMQEIVASDGATGDNFGNSVAIDGDFAIIGSPNDDIGAHTDIGSAYIFKKVGCFWIEFQKITASDGATNNLFGLSVDIKGNYAIVGGSASVGKSYVFFFNGTTWVEQQIIIPTGGFRASSYLIKVRINYPYLTLVDNGNLSILGGPCILHEGKTWIYKASGSTWSFQNTFTNTTANLSAADISNNTVILADENCTNGSIKSYTTSGSSWLAGTTFNLGSSYETRYFTDLYSDGVNNKILITEWDYSFNKKFSVYNYTPSIISYYQTLTEPLVSTDTGNRDAYGVSNSIYGDKIIIGSPFDDEGAYSNQGCVYIHKFSGGSWSLSTRLFPNTGANNQRFGNAVSSSNNHFIVGAPTADTIGGTGAGRVSIGLW